MYIDLLIDWDDMTILKLFIEPIEVNCFYKTVDRHGEVILIEIKELDDDYILEYETKEYEVK